MASAEGTGAKRDTGEFAGFMADIAEEIAQRVSAIVPAAAEVPKSDDAVITDWEDVTDRIIEEPR
ncbi:MAG TPA: hypothetical protein VNJ04_07510 [Gemmatimonadaceae bacterium]|nr:hypothetical protein [Gemmatimonadaceae bacterium]